VLALACLGMRRAFAGSADAWALSLNAFAALLISPISWSHHWVWGETAVLTLALLGRRHQRRGELIAAACGLAVFAAAPQWWFPSGGNRELYWTAGQQVVGSSYVIFASVMLLLSAHGAVCYRPIRDISWPHRSCRRRHWGSEGRCGCGIRDAGQ
jgi:alpha-1,2-mannosyltransferase